MKTTLVLGCHISNAMMVRPKGTKESRRFIPLPIPKYFYRPLAQQNRA